MNRLRIHRAFVLLLVTGVTGFFIPANGQQKVQFTQYMFNGLVINPAYAGADEALSLTFIQRSQWIGVENAPTTQTLSAHTLFKRKHTGVGFTLINDRIGIHKNQSGIGNYAYHIRTGAKSYFSMGLQAGVHHRRSDYGSLMGSNSSDPRLSSTPVAHTFFDFGMGVYYRSPRFHAGISAPELIPERISINDTLSIRLSKVNYFLFTKYRIRLNERLELEPGVFLKFFSGVPFSYDLNVNLIVQNVLTMGLSHRRNESVDILLKALITPQLQIGYSYDFPIGEISRLSNGSHEIMIQYLFRYAHGNVSSPR